MLVSCCGTKPLIHFSLVESNKNKMFGPNNKINKTATLC